MVGRECWDEFETWLFEDEEERKEFQESSATFVAKVEEEIEAKDREIAKELAPKLKDRALEAATAWVA